LSVKSVTVNTIQGISINNSPTVVCKCVLFNGFCHITEQHDFWLSCLWTMTQGLFMFIDITYFWEMNKSFWVSYWLFNTMCGAVWTNCFENEPTFLQILSMIWEMHWSDWLASIPVFESYPNANSNMVSGLWSYSLYQDIYLFKWASVCISTFLVVIFFYSSSVAVNA